MAPLSSEDKNALMGRRVEPSRAPIILPPSRPPRHDPLADRLSFKLREHSIVDATAMLTRLTGVNLAPTPEAIEYCEARRLKLNLTAVDISLRNALDWIVRQIDCHYVVDPDFGVLITRAYECLAQEPIIRRTYDLSTTMRFDSPIAGRYDVNHERNAVIDIAGQILRVAQEHCPNSGLGVGSREELLLVAGPARSHELMGQLMHEISLGEQRSTSPLPSMDDAQLARMEKDLATPLECRHFDRLALDILDDLARGSGTNIGLDPRHMPQLSATRLTLNMGETTLRAALQAFSEQAGLGGFVMEPEHGIWLTGRKEPRESPGSGEFFWDRAVVRSYYVKPLLAGMDILTLFDEVQHNITPDQWRGLGPVIGYHPAGRLIVFHDPPAQRAISRLINRLAALHEQQETP